MHRSDIHFDQLPKKRNPDQIWLFWHDEPGGIQTETISYQFNWTISYRFNAEVNIGAYGLTILRTKPLSLKEFDFYINKQFTNRQANALWFVSNCQPKARLNFYTKFRFYYPSITVYGACVSQNTTNQCYRRSQCEISELSKNKFYLAFESQSCRDYITEKFWRSLAYGAIPIVFGPRDKQSLERIAPPNSFIYTDDFSSVLELAEYLNEISRNRTLFTQYHRWRRFYEIRYRPEDIEHYRFCELCYRLNTNQNRIYYQNLNEFFLEDC
jgi:alpha-1,3-fucosyltransferase